MEIICILVFAAIIVFGLKLLFPANKNKKTPQKKAAPKKAAVPQRNEPANQDTRPQYVQYMDGLIAFIDSNITDLKAIYVERPHKPGVPVPEDLARLPKPEGYEAGHYIVILSGDGKLNKYLINNGGLLSDMVRGKFGMMLAKHYGMNCRLYTAQVPTAKGKLTERVLGFIISRNVDNGSQPIPQEDPVELDITQTIDAPAEEDGGIAAIPVDIQNINASVLAKSVIEWEDIDDGDEEE